MVILGYRLRPEHGHRALRIPFVVSAVKTAQLPGINHVADVDMPGELIDIIKSRLSAVDEDFTSRYIKKIKPELSASTALTPLSQAANTTGTAAGPASGRSGRKTSSATIREVTQSRRVVHGQ